MDRLSLVLALLVAIPPIITGTAHSQELTADVVRDAIEGGAQYLKNQQQGDGSWGSANILARYPGGAASLCTLALLYSGVDPSDASISRALGYLRKMDEPETYSVSLQTMVFCKVGLKRDRPLIARNVRWLEEHQVRQGEDAGGWGYPTHRADNSNSQFALLALYEADRAGVTVHAETWRLAKTYWEGAQNPDGSWGYPRRGGGTGSMTCAGIASLLIASDMAHRSDASVDAGRIVCCQRALDANERVNRATQWLGRYFSTDHNPGRGGEARFFYYMYGVERVGRLTAARFVGEHDWYREGATALLRRRNDIVGSWKGEVFEDTDERVATSFALLFLSRGRLPILMAKWQHGDEHDWNAHRNDIHHLTRFVESRWQRDLTWQVVDPTKATVEELLQSPVLYLSGKNSPMPDSEAAAEKLARKIRDYLDRGGFIFAEPVCGGEAFDQGFRQLLRRVFPEPEYRLHPLSPEHPIWRIDQPVSAEAMRPLLGVDFACRTSIVYAAPDRSAPTRPSLSCLWELSAVGRSDGTLPADARSQVDAARAIGVNVLAYATGRELKFKAPVVRRAAVPVEDAFPRGRFAVAALRHPGGCTVAPRAMPALLEEATERLKARVEPEVRLIDITDPALFHHPIVFMHGRNAFHLTDAEREQLKTYLDRGGLLFANAICASKTFTASFRREIGSLFDDAPLIPIPPDDPLLSTDYGGFDLKTVQRRDPPPRGSDEDASPRIRRVPPELEGLQRNGRWAVVFSPYDLSCSLQRHTATECPGYLRDDAARIGLNVLLYGLQ